MKSLQFVVLTALIFCLIIPAAAAAQTAVRQAGRVLDQDDNPIEGAKVVATDMRTNRSQETTTDKNGRFTFRRLFEGRYVFTVTKEGYIGHNAEIQLMPSNTMPLIMHLLPDPGAGKPTNEDFARAAEMLQNRQYAEAREIFIRFIDAFPELAAAWFNLGICSYALQDFPGAAEAFDETIKLEPQNTNAMIFSAQAHTQLREVPAAIELYEKYLQLKADDLEIWHTVGQLYNFQGNREKALEAFDKALELNPDYADSHIMKGFTLVELQRPDEAILHLEKYLELMPDSTEAGKVREGLAQIYRDKGDKLMSEVKYEQAIECLTRYLELKPDAEDAEEVKAMIEAAQAELQ